MKRYNITLRTINLKEFKKDVNLNICVKTASGFGGTHACVVLQK